MHVVDYNESAIRFYEKNQFRTLKRVKEHYMIFEKIYDGLLLYKDIKAKDNNDNDDFEKNAGSGRGVGNLNKIKDEPID